jgi:alpha-tubulin suppressor-like RCC1 family protein
MVNIVDSNAKVELETLISGLTLASETTSSLALILKTADLSSVYAETIKTELISRLNSANTADSLEEIALLSASLQFITDNRSISVTNLSDLTLLSVDPGTIVFVVNENLPYVYKSDLTWVLLFPTITGASPIQNAWAWGTNSDGQLGDNTTVSKSSPVSVVGGYTDWIQVSAGTYHNLGLRANGTAWAWGLNATGQLGNETTTAQSSPVSIVGGFTDWTQLSGGFKHSLGLRANGTLWAWGYNFLGELGDNTIVDKSSPVSVVGGFTDWVQVSSGSHHGIALRGNGTAWGWGENAFGRLGDNTTVDKSSPVSVVGGFADWIQLSAGSIHSLGVRANGTAWGWGNNASGRLGDTTTTAQSSPVSVVGGFADWIQLSAGGSHSLGLRANGTAWAWGFNGSGMLGDNTTVSKTSPVSVVGGFTDWVQLDAGQVHSVGLRANGTAWAWGSNASGALGDNTIVNKSSPVSVVGGFTDWVQISAVTHSTGIRGS